LMGKTGTGERDEADDAADDMEMEAQVLRMEGLIEEALELEGFIRQNRREKRQKQLDAVKQAGMLAGRGLMDTVEILDKAFLEQDSDSISLSDDDNDDGGGTGKKKGKKGKKYGGKTRLKPLPNAQRNPGGPSMPRVNPLDRVKFHFGLAGAEAVAAAGAAADDRAHEERHINLFDVDHTAEVLSKPKDRDKLVPLLEWSSPERAREKAEEAAKEQELEHQKKLTTDINQLLVKDDDDESDDDDGRGMTGLERMAYRQARRMEQSIKAIRGEVRSYKEAADAAQNLLKMMPKPVIAAPKSGVCIIA
jgi:hypothetical protein